MELVAKIEAAEAREDVDSVADLVDSITDETQLWETVRNCVPAVMIAREAYRRAREIGADPSVGRGYRIGVSPRG